MHISSNSKIPPLPPLHSLPLLPLPPCVDYYAYGKERYLNTLGEAIELHSTFKVRGEGVRWWRWERMRVWQCVCVTLLSFRLVGGPSLHMLWIKVSFHRMTSESEPVTLEWTHSLVATCSVFCILYSPSFTHKHTHKHTHARTHTHTHTHTFKAVLTILSMGIMILSYWFYCTFSCSTHDLQYLIWVLMRLVLMWVFVVTDAHVTCKIYTFIINCMQLQGFPIDSHIILLVRHMIMFFLC